MGGAAVEMGMGRFDLEKPEMSPVKTVPPGPGAPWRAMEAGQPGREPETHCPLRRQVAPGWKSMVLGTGQPQPLLGPWGAAWR